MNKSDFNYYLPDELIAQTPAEPRDSSRLLVYDGKKDEITHAFFYNLPKYLKNGDLLVINNTKVIPARIFGTRDAGGKVELLLLKRLDYTRWQCLAKPGKNAKIGETIHFEKGLKAKIVDIIEEGIRIAEFSFEGVFEDILSQIGQMPLPPYIKTKLQDKNRYNTVYSKIEGSAAAPTAGLHFTQSLLEEIKNNGNEIAEVLLSVGLGTFRPVKEDDIEKHAMHSEYYEVSPQAAEKINAAKAQGGRIIAVGTTSARVLESAADEKGALHPFKGETDIFIYPPYKFKVVDALITNFHLPESTLIMLVSALCGREKILEIYKEAVNQKYRFFSFGDAMFLEAEKR